MKPRSWRKILKIETHTLHQATTEPKTFSVRWRKTPGNYGERIFQAPTPSAAIRLAPAIAGLAAPDNANHRKQIPLTEAFNLALRAARRGPGARNDWHGAVKVFARWLTTSEHKHVYYWHQLTRPILRDYLSSCADLSPNGQRMRLQPIRQTDNFLAREYGYPPIAQGLAIGSALAHGVAKVYLDDLLNFLDHLRRNAPPHIEAAAALQGLAGLRLTEAYRLTTGRIDTQAALVEISGEIKRPWSERVIPICNRARETLQRAIQAPPARGNIRNIGPEPLVPGYATWTGYSNALKRHIKDWNPRIAWTPKDLRKALSTWAAAEGRESALLEQYLGHAPTGVTARHYIPRLASVSAGEAGELTKQMDQFRRIVILPLEAAIAKKEKVPPFSTQAADTT